MPAQCIYCGTILKRGKGKTKSARGASIDHVIPQSILRATDYTLTDRQRFYNKVPCCMSCNGRKANMDPRKWVETLNDPKRRETVLNIMNLLPIAEIYR